MLLAYFCFWSVLIWIVCLSPADTYGVSFLRIIGEIIISLKILGLYAADPSVTVWLRWFSSALINNG